MTLRVNPSLVIRRQYVYAKAPKLTLVNTLNKVKHINVSFYQGLVQPCQK